MKIILMTVMLIFIFKITNAKQNDDDSSKLSTLQSAQISEAKTPVTGSTRSLPNKTKKFMVTLKQPVKTSYTLPKRTPQKSSIPKLQIQYNVPKGSIGIFPVLSTKRPHLMQTRKFISKPHTIDRAQQVTDTSNFNNKRTPSKFIQTRQKTEEILKSVNKNEYKTEDPENVDERFKNFKDIDISSENDSEESKEYVKLSAQRFIKVAASHKVTTIASPPITNAKVARNYKIKDLLKDQKYMPQVERKKMPVLAFQKSDTTGSIQNEDVKPAIQISEGLSENNLRPSNKNNDYSSEERADQNEFIFIKENKHKSMTTTTLSPEDDEIVTMDTIDADVRQERSVNIIEEESVATTSGAKFTAKDWPMSLQLAYKNIHT